MGLHHAAVKDVTVGVNAITKSITVASPYNPDFTQRARGIGGRWDAGGRVWTFPPIREAEVRDLCMSVYGTCSGAPAQTREMLEASLAQHLAAIVAIQQQLNKLDGKDGEEVE